MTVCALFCRRYRRKKLLSEIRSLICFDITAEDSDAVVNNWVFNCSGKDVLGSSSVVQVQTASAGELQKVKYDAKIICSDSTFAALAKGKISPEFAYMRGTLKIKGQVNAALKVKTLLSLAADFVK